MDQMDGTGSLSSELTVEQLVRGVLTLEQGQAKKVFKTLQDGLENLVAQNLIPTSVAKQFRQLRAKILKEGEKKMIFDRLNFDGCEAEYEDKNRDFFGTLFGVNEISYERRSCDGDTYYDLLWVNRGTEDENCIPIPVFLQIIGHGEVDGYAAVVDLLKEGGFSTEVDHGSCLPDEIVGDAEAIKKYLLENPGAFCEEHLLPEMADDKEFVLGLIEKRVEALNSHMCFISERLKGDKDVALAAISLATNNYVGITPELQKDSDVIEAMFEHEEGPHWLIAGSKEVLDSLDIMSRAVRQQPDMLNVACPSCDYLKKNTRLMVEAIGASDKPQIILHYYQDLSAEQRRDPEIQKVMEEKRGKFGNREVSVPNPDCWEKGISQFMCIQKTLKHALDAVGKS
ncbi:MAG: DUF4116 domain-containing protein [Candidatus Pacebacteria bacterium]|nr:DUF4116 domain-containing protein [Candidatus Paceibacterota bacterium]